MNKSIIVRAIVIAFIASLPACIVTTGPGAAHHRPHKAHHKKKRRRKARAAKKAQQPAPTPAQTAPAVGPSTAPASTTPATVAPAKTAPKTTARAVANAKGWKLLGERKVAFGGDHDVIPVKGRVATNGFRALRLVVKGSPLEMFKMKITFGNNKSHSPKLRHVFRQGSWTRRIDLPGDVRNIKRVEFWYRSVGRHSGKATVKLFGQR